uniref:Uncharacterized protein n=1 Tax=Glossina austeni TaxID=7395 RepID=A0A1A9UMU8_GLOAU
MTWPPSYVRLNSSTLQLCIGMCVGGKCNVYLTPSSLVMTGKSLRDKRALIAATKATASSRGFTTCSTTAKTLRMLAFALFKGNTSLTNFAIRSRDYEAKCEMCLLNFNFPTRNVSYEGSAKRTSPEKEKKERNPFFNLTPERKFHKVLSSTIFKPSHDFGGSGGGGGGGGGVGGGSGGGVVNKITCIKAGRDNITAQVKRPPYGSVEFQLNIT